MKLSIRMNKWGIAAAGVALAAGLALAATNLSGAKPEAGAPVPVRVAVAEAAGGAAGLRYSANILPREQVDLAFKVGGYVREIVSVKGEDGSVRELRAGDRVTRGMVLARLDLQDHAARASQARAALEEAKASLVQAQKDYERAQTLVAGGYLAKSEFDRTQEKLGVCRARLDGARAQLAQAELQVADAQLRSPLDGVVVSRQVERGTLVAGGTKAFVLVDLSAVKAVFGVADAQLPKVKPGSALTVRVEALGRDFTGRVTAVSPAADPTSRVFDVEVSIPNPDGALKDGMIAAVRTQGMDGVEGGAAPQSALASVPLQAVVRPPDDPKGYMVFVAAEQGGKVTAQARRVRLGDVAGRSVSVLEGLAQGERVVTAGSAQLHDGAAVVIVP